MKVQMVLVCYTRNGDKNSDMIHLWFGEVHLTDRLDSPFETVKISQGCNRHWEAVPLNGSERVK